MKQAIIKCSKDANGKHLNFYAVSGESSLFIFSRKYNNEVSRYFRNGVPVSEVFNFSKANRKPAVMNIMEQLPVYIRFVEREYGVELLRKRAVNRRSGRISELRAAETLAEWEQLEYEAV
ncbi:MAG: hypothetical protein ACI4WS_08170 [Oscillospiraceae bacterium]